jgi:predicted protein tyrosine phosphatase
MNEDEHMEPAGKRILFVCRYNEMRSATAETVFKAEGRNVRSAGTEARASVPLSDELILWADLILVMEEKYRIFIESVFSEAAEGKQIVVLGIPDNYYYMEPALVELLKEKAGPYMS